MAKKPTQAAAASSESDLSHTKPVHKSKPSPSIKPKPRKRKAARRSSTSKPAKRPRKPVTAAAPLTHRPRAGRGRPRLTDAQKAENKAARREEVNRRQRERRAKIRRAKQDANNIRGQAGVTKGPQVPAGGAAGGFIPTLDQRAQVEILAGRGIRQDEIAILIFNEKTKQSINEKTLRLHFGVELKRGPASAHEQIAGSLFDKAMGEGPGAVTAGIYLTKALMGWREHQHIEVEVKSGVLIAPAGMTPEAWVAAAQESNEGKTEPGKEA